MPTIIERNGRYLARVRKEGFKPVAKSFIRKSDAIAWGRKTEADMQGGRYQETGTAPVPALRDAIRQYRAGVADRLKGGVFYAYTFDQLSAEPMASKPLPKVTPADVAAWRDGMAARGLAPGTVVRRLGLLSGLFTWAQQERGWVKVNPVKDVRKPRVSDARDRTLTDEEQRYLMASAQASRCEWLADSLVVLFRSAMRRGELFGLRVGDVDSVRGVAVLVETKAGGGREVPLDGLALGALGRLCEAAKARHQADARKRGDDDRSTSASALAALPLLPVSDAPAVSLAFRRVLARARKSYAQDCDKAGTVPAPGFLDDVRLHDIRHCAVTSWALAGLTLPELMLVSGHKTPAMLTRYVNLSASTLASKLATLSA